MNKIGNIMDEVVNNICPPVKKTIWVLLWKENKGDDNYGEPDRIDSFWFNKPTVEQVLSRLYGNVTEHAVSLLKGKTIRVGSDVLRLKEMEEGEAL